MKTLKFKPFFLFLGLSIALVSCGGETAEGSGDGEAAAEAVMTTQEFIAAANKMGEEEFAKKYPKGSEVTLEGEIRVPATWKDKVAVKFGTGMNDLPLTANFMFEANGGKEATKEKVAIGTVVAFTGKIGFFFFNEGKMTKCEFEDCTPK